MTAATPLAPAAPLRILGIDFSSAPTTRKPITVRLDFVDPAEKRFLPSLDGNWVGTDANGAAWTLSLATDPIGKGPGRKLAEGIGKVEPGRERAIGGGREVEIGADLGGTCRQIATIDVVDEQACCHQADKDKRGGCAAAAHRNRPLSRQEWNHQRG